MARGAIFINPRSGTATRVSLDELSAIASQSSLDIVTIDGDIDVAAEVRRRLALGEKLMIAAGGDGTIHHISQALVGTQARLGILPVGTVNHLAKDLHLPLDWKQALEIALHGQPKEIDVGLANGIYFINILMLGVYPDVVREREKLRGKHGRVRAYFRASRLAFQRYRHVSFVFESDQRMEVVKTHIFAVAVNPYDLENAGLVAPKVAFDHGKLAVYWLPKMSRLHTLRAFSRYLRGRMKLGDELRYFSTRQLTIHSRHSRMRVGVDGELRQLDSPLRVTIVPRALTVMVPEE